MPKTKHRPKHAQQLQKFKQKLKMAKEKEVGQTLPEFRNIPVWDANAKIEIFGYEWEVIYNTVAQMQLLGQATNAVMSRNIVNGNISMDFEKLNAESLSYESMSDSDKAPLKADFEKMVVNLRNQQNEQMAMKSHEEGKVVKLPKEKKAEERRVDVSPSGINSSELPTSPGPDYIPKTDNTEKKEEAEIISLS